MSILRELFRSSMDEIWSQLSQEIGAEYRKDFFSGNTVTLKHRQWEVKMDTYTTNRGKWIFTRIQAPYVNLDGFRFNIYRKNIFASLGKLVGVQDITVGDPFFDEQFIVQGKPNDFVVGLLTKPRIRELIQRQPDIHFQIRDDEGLFGRTMPKDVDVLYFSARGIIEDKQRLKELFDLFAVVLDEMCVAGSAYEGDPGIGIW